MLPRKRYLQHWTSSILSAVAILPAFVAVTAFGWFGLGVVTPAAAGGMRVQGVCDTSRCQQVEFVRDVIADHAGISTARPWHFRRRLGFRTVEIAVSWTACNRRPASTIRTRVIERPGRAVITTLVHVPAPPTGTPCLRQRQRRNIRVRLAMPVAQLKLYDGSYSPPRLRWPK
jgi:hypothetical protein